MPKTLRLVVTAALLAGGLSGCDAQRWVSTIKSPLAAAAAEADALSPTYSLSGRVEAKLLNTPHR